MRFAGVRLAGRRRRAGGHLRRVNGGRESETAADRGQRFGDFAEDQGEMGNKAKGFGEGLGVGVQDG